MTDLLDLLGNNTTVAEVDYDNDLKQLRVAWNKGLKGVYTTSEETKRKISIASSSRKHTDDAKRKISEATTGKKKTIDEETKRRLSELRKNRKHTEESRRKIREAVKGYKRTEEHQRKICEALYKKSKRHNGKTINEWAQLLGVHRDKVDYHLRQHGHLEVLIKKMETA